MRSIRAMKLLLLSSVVFVIPAHALAGGYDMDAPDEDYVWEDGHELEDGTVIQGYYRVRTRPGHTWVAGHYANGAWVSAHWKAAAPAPAGNVWVAGHRGRDGFWIPGHWRLAKRPDHKWVPARVVNGAWVHGHWVPVAARPGNVWVPGHRTRSGKWIPGHWRRAAYTGHSWVRGHWAYGRWITGHWRPIKKRRGHVWVAGHIGPNGWVKGHWRPKAKRGHWWKQGYWRGGVWHTPRWVKGPPPRIKRQHRVRPVRYMAKKRRAHRNLWRKGQRQVRQGRAIKRAGKRIERRGHKTGRPGMVKKGKQIRKKGQRRVNRGKVNKSRGRR